MGQLAQTFKALADPTRLRILNLLPTAPGSVCELQAVLGLPQPLISRHFAYLRNAELVDDERHGVRVLYRLRTEGPAGDKLRLFLGSVLPLDERLRKKADAWRSFRARGSRMSA